MCPLRLILVFFSATLAGYFAWKSIRSNSDEASHELTANTLPKKSASSFEKVSSAIVGGFWGFVDMASGRYLWRNLRLINDQKAKAC